MDLLKTNHELCLGNVSECISEYSLEEYHLPLVNDTSNNKKTNQKKSAQILDSSHFNEANLKLGLISPDGKTILELSDRFNISQRTVYRYFDTFNPVYQCR